VSVTSRRFLVLSGPNLHRLGRREPGIYGNKTLDDIHLDVAARAAVHGVAVETRQSNHEGLLIDWIGDAEDQGFHGVALNPGAYTHTSWALHDAIRGANIPVVELHLSNPAAREEFRHHSCTASACVGSITGFGPRSYLLALDALVALTENPK
jgi:3-dehydroquinate dehydratase II